LTQYGVMMIQYGAAHSTIPSTIYLPMAFSKFLMVVSIPFGVLRSCQHTQKLFTRCDPSTGTQSA